MSELLEKIAISLVKGIGPKTARSLVSTLGGVSQVFSASDEQLLSIPKISKSIIESLRDPYVFDRAAQEISFMERNNVTPLFYLDSAYPKRLEFCDDAPVLLYAKGDLNFNNRKVIAVVGTRNSTAYGRDMCERIISDLSKYNPLIVSGLAMGIDSAAHKAAVDNNLQTVGVLAHGVDSIYPPSSRAIAARMQSNGGVISEFMSGTVPIRENFPTRNRVIAGMCDALIIVESKKRGGSIISAELAFGYHREVFAVPGKASDLLSEGCNDLIKYQKAVMITDGKDVAREMNWSAPSAKQKQPELFPDLNVNEKTILEAINSSSGLAIDDMGAKTGLNSSELAQILLQLEFNGLVRVLPGKIYESA
ncbi:MAG: DNA-processing protein DprA [Flavobacteriales bacterium]